MGYGTELTSNKGNTPGKDMRTESVIEKNRRGIKHLLICCTHSAKSVQPIRTILHTWRANVDVQLLIYQSNPNMANVGEIEAVSKYCKSIYCRLYE